MVLSMESLCIAPTSCVPQISSSGATTIQHVPIPPSMGSAGNTLQGPTHLPHAVGMPSKASPSHHASMVAAAAAVAAVAVVSWQLVEVWTCAHMYVHVGTSDVI